MQNREFRSNTKFDLEDRLIEFSVTIIEITELLPKTAAGRHFGNQLLRSGSSPALNYGEAQSAESRKDFIHKMKICLKELRETYICLRIINKKPLINNEPILQDTLSENNELISIFVKSIATARKNLNRG